MWVNREMGEWVRYHVGGGPMRAVVVLLPGGGRGPGRGVSRLDHRQSIDWAPSSCFSYDVLAGVGTILRQHPMPFALPVSIGD